VEDMAILTVLREVNYESRVSNRPLERNPHFCVYREERTCSIASMEQNKDANYIGIVDDTRLFEFIEQMRVNDKI